MPSQKHRNRTRRIIVDAAIDEAWQALCEMAGAEPSVAVRSSATAEDLPDASFAGQQETFLNVVGLPEVKTRIREVFASLYNDRAISYRVHQGFAHADVARGATLELRLGPRPNRAWGAQPEDAPPSLSTDR